MPWPRLYRLCPGQGWYQCGGVITAVTDRVELTQLEGKASQSSCPQIGVAVCRDKLSGENMPSIYSEKDPSLTFFLNYKIQSILSRGEETAQEGGQLKAFMAGTGRTGHKFPCWKLNGRDHSCCLSFVIVAGFCQLGSCQCQHSSFFQEHVWDHVKAVHPSPGSHAGKGAARHYGGRQRDEGRVSFFAGVNLLLAGSTDLCSCAAVPEQGGNFCHYPLGWSSSVFQTLSTPWDRVWLVPLQVAMVLAEVLNQSPRLLKP